MTNHTADSVRSVPWMLILGLSSLALLWPLTALTGIAGQGAVRAGIIFMITAVVWIGTVGFGRVRRPVSTLTLTGLAYGFIALVIAGFTPGGGGPFGDTTTLWAFIPALVVNAGLGAFAGLVAVGVQASLGPKGEES